MSKFAIGDEVRIKKDLIVGKQYFMDTSGESEIFSGRMRNYLGKEAIIVKASANGYKVDIDVFHSYTDEMFDYVEDIETIFARQDAQLADELIAHMLRLIPEQLINHALDTEDKALFQEVTKAKKE